MIQRRGSRGMLRRIGITLLVAMAASASLAQPVYAYLDPGTGSYVIQLLLAAIVGGLFAVKLYWRKLKRLFHRSAVEEEGDDAGGE